MRPLNRIENYDIASVNRFSVLFFPISLFDLEKTFHYFQVRSYFKHNNGKKFRLIK